MTRIFLSLCCAALTLVGNDAIAQDASPGASRAAIPVRKLTTPVRGDSTVLMQIAAVRHLPNGSVIVNDASKRQLVLFDSTLSKYRIIADTSTNSPNSYGLRGYNGGLIPYVADSSLFVDMESFAFLVIDPQGNFARVMAPTRANDLNYISYGFYGMAGFDPKGRMIYRTYRPQPQSTMINYATMPNGTIVTNPDSAPLLRMDFDARTVDTIGMIKIPAQKFSFFSTPTIRTSYGIYNPLTITDEWTLMPDGTIAIVRGQDYHIDWLLPDGKLESSPKMPFEWKRITLDEKRQLIDSVKKVEAERRAKLPPPPPPIPGQTTFPVMPFVTVEPTELPDYYPAVRSGEVRADREGNVWILPATSTMAKDGLLYDVVNRKGEVFERVQLPPNRALVGFGPNGIVYMNYVRVYGKSTLERASVLR